MALGRVFTYKDEEAKELIDKEIFCSDIYYNICEFDEKNPGDHFVARCILRGMDKRQPFPFLIEYMRNGRKMYKQFIREKLDD